MWVDYFGNKQVPAATENVYKGTPGRKFCRGCGRLTRASLAAAEARREIVICGRCSKEPITLKLIKEEAEEQNHVEKTGSTYNDPRRERGSQFDESLRYAAKSTAGSRPRKSAWTEQQPNTSNRQCAGNTTRSTAATEHNCWPLYGSEHRPNETSNRNA